MKLIGQGAELTYNKHAAWLLGCGSNRVNSKPGQMGIGEAERS